MTTRCFRRVAATVLLLASGLAGRTRAETAEVTYVTSATVYLGAGETGGIVPGTRLTGGGDPPVVLEAFEATERRSACRVVSGPAEGLQPGVQFTYLPTIAPAQATPPKFQLMVFPLSIEFTA